MKPCCFVLGLLACSLICFAEIGRIPGETLVKPVFDGSDLVCYGYVEAITITRGEMTSDEYGNTFSPDVMRAEVKVVDVFKGQPNPSRKIAVQDLHKTAAGMQPFSLLQKGAGYVLFLTANSSRIYGLADPSIGAVRLAKVGQHTSGMGLAKLESALTITILGSDRNDRVTALRLLQGFGSLDQKTITAVDPLCDSPDPDLAFTALAILVKTKTPESVARLASRLAKGKNDQQTFAVISIGPELAQVHDERALSAMEQLTDSRIVSIRDGAMQSLRAIRSPKSAPTLIRKLDDSDALIQYQAVITLAEIFDKKNQQFAPTIPTFNQSPRKYIEAWKKWWDEEGQNLVPAKNFDHVIQDVIS